MTKFEKKQTELNTINGVYLHVQHMADCQRDYAAEYRKNAADAGETDPNSGSLQWAAEADLQADILEGLLKLLEKTYL